MVDGVSDEDSLVAWELFLSAYSKGEYLHSCPDIPPLPPRLREMLEHPELAQYGKDNPHTPLFPSTYIDRETARIARDFFCAHGYLPPPRPTTEKSREACVLEYDLLSESQLTNIQEAVDILSGFFPGALISFSLFYKRVQQYYAFAGPQEYIDLFSLCKGGAIPVEDSLCAHAVLSAGKTVFIPDAKKDWRYRYNPYVLRGMEAYIGSPVRLSEDPTRPEAELITIGTLNVCFMNKTVEQVLGREEQAISYVSQMLQTMLRATWQGHVGTREGRVRTAIGNFLECSLKMSQEEKANKDSRDGPASMRELHDRGLHDLAHEAVKTVRCIFPELKSVSLIDVRGVVATRRDNGLHYIHSKTRPPVILAQSGSGHPHLEADYIVDRLFESSRREEGLVLSEGLADCSNPATAPSGALEVQIHIALPFSNGDPPVLMFYVVSERRHLPQQTLIVQMLRSMGSVLRAKVLLDQASEADATKTAFLSSVSHELRTPLHNILLGLGLMHLQAGDEDDLIPELVYSARLLQSTLNDMLDYGTPSIERTSNVSRVDLVVTLRNAIKMCIAHYLPRDSSTRVELRYDVASIVVDIDEAKFARVVMNGLSNALKSCHARQDAQVAVKISANPTDLSNLLLSIEDTGIGISPEIQERLFAPFVKGDDAQPGAGLGLHITKRLVSSMRGNVDIRSQPGHGTKFQVRLPTDFYLGRRSDQPSPARAIESDSNHVEVMRHHCQAVSTVQEIIKTDHPSVVEDSRATVGVSDLASSVEKVSLKQPTLPLSAATENVQLSSSAVPHNIHVTQAHLAPSKLRVLVADDNAICLKLLSTALRSCPESPSVREARNGLEAVKIHAEFLPHLVITDVSMPIMDGLTAAGHMRERDKACGRSPIPSQGGQTSGSQSRIYALTALGSSDPRSKVLGMDGSAALDGWLTKGKDQVKAIQNIVRELHAHVAEPDLAGPKQPPTTMKLLKPPLIDPVCA